ncbi:spore coat protein SP96-like [Ammospiza nelsoni]|uniref:spore coat protein SP96-like n=1 Tax=Ammospiza nelsoni TaxID=2857394 RepID=UPI002869B5FA|nr:spore coat protein SP96-like [Ammospiza nelsoni]
MEQNPRLARVGRDFKENLGGTGQQSSCPPRDTAGSGQSLEHTEPTPAAPKDAAEPRESPGRRQEPPEPGNAAGSEEPGRGRAAEPERKKLSPGRAAEPEGSEPGPGRAAQPGEHQPGPSGSPPWPRAPEESPARPSTLDLGSSLGRLQELKQRRGSDRAALRDNGLEATMTTATATTMANMAATATITATTTASTTASTTATSMSTTTATTTATTATTRATTVTTTGSSEERQALQSELGKCIEEFRRIRIPAAFPNKKRQWQSELLRKYQL